MTDHSPASKRLYWLAIALIAGFAAVRFWLTRDLALFGDEAFYWLESQHPDWGYSDVPLLTPLLVGLGDAMSTMHYSSVRLLFVVLGSLIPLAVWWLALPLTGPRHALGSLFFSMCLPLLAGMGVLALPDVPLVFISILVLGMAVRVQQQPDALIRWLMLGVLMAAGFLAHYRFALIPIALLIASLSHPASRALWRKPAPWLSCLIAALGLLPALWFNLNNHYAAIAFHFAQRHPWQFQAEGLMYPVMQGLVVSPLLLLALLAAFIPLWRASRDNLPGARILLATSLLYLGVFGVLAPWADQRSTNIHWPLTGYIPLLVFLPVWLADCATRYGQRAARILAATAGLSGLAGCMLGATWLHAMPRLDELPYSLQRHITANMAGWADIAGRVQAHNTHQPVITDNYYLAAQLAFELQRTEAIITLDDDKAFRDGRARQLMLWGWIPDNDTWPESATAALEVSRHNTSQWQQIADTLCARYPGIRTLEHIEQFNGRRLITLLALDGEGEQDVFCDTPMQGWIDSAPHSMTPNLVWQGWYTHPSGIASIELLLDGIPVSTARYGMERPDVARTLGQGTSPDMPFVGFKLSWEPRQTPAGWHRLQLRISSHSGQRITPWERWMVFP